eukprot:gb/GFBE01019512.1/.p1 GENE.gb/GFBE01019512.1/~~gb/GFBE01019512.1/.p1  ORF type:complete len:354 (+),score=61.10 gb/GFBE01019512.1/:1-1062(+)
MTSANQLLLAVILLLQGCFVWTEPAADGTCAAGDAECSATHRRNPNVKVRKCSLPAGDDVVPPQRLSIARAVKECKRISGCRAVSAHVDSDYDAKKEYMFHFKTKTTPCEKDPGSRTALLNTEDVELKQSAWPGPPLPEHWLRYPNSSLILEDPPVVKFDGFLSDAEIDHIMNLARSRFVKSSTGMTYDTNNLRTSETAWLTSPDLQEDPVLNGITARITGLTAVPNNNMEPFQVVRYQAGQHFNGHQDYLNEQQDQVCGGRVGTFFMYLNDVASGGETDFERWNFKVTPRRGMAVLWWNSNYTALREGKFETGKIMDAWHQALPVKEGEKWVVNRWLHPYDFLTPYYEGKLR